MSKSPMVSYPVSGPRAFRARLLTFRRAPMCSCWTQPFSAFIEASSNSSADLNFRVSPAVGFFPRLALSNARAASFAVKAAA